ncbi:MAG: DNA polymerase III subunit beta [Candidatus Peregrinibacteria bacterium Greene0416_19]|nr:MAG: DNA polymerase III subunit beta [Candidatus Peregrinibacteria bacterium Greene0416_19]
MKFSCNTGVLLGALQLVSRAIGSQQALPILGNILMRAEGDTCTFSATDLELSIITSFPAHIENEGSVTIPAKAILNFAQYNHDPEVLLQTKEGTQLTCTSHTIKAMIAGEAANDYPTITRTEKQSSLTIRVEPLLQALHLVTFAAARSTLRPVLSGVYVRSEGGTLILVATDSYRLSEYKIPADGAVEGISCIIPTKILEELKVALSSNRGEKAKGAQAPPGPETVEAILGKQQIEWQIGSTSFLSRLIEGKFPDYRQILPKESKTKIHFTTDELLTTIKRMHYFAKEVNNNLTFHSANGQTRIITPPTQAGRDEATLQAEMTGEENKIALSSSYLLDFLGHINTDTVTMHMTDSLHPAVFTLPGEEKFLHLVMPLRMQEE